MILQSLSQQPPHISQIRLAPAENRTQHEESVNFMRYHRAMAVIKLKLTLNGG